MRNETCQIQTFPLSLFDKLLRFHSKNHFMNDPCGWRYFREIEINNIFYSVFNSLFHESLFIQHIERCFLNGTLISCYIHVPP